MYSIYIIEQDNQPVHITAHTIHPSMSDKDKLGILMSLATIPLNVLRAYTQHKESISVSIYKTDITNELEANREVLEALNTFNNTTIETPINESISEPEKLEIKKPSRKRTKKAS
ncbi:hypothetical protein RFK95_17655 [Acinetobacter pittii]|uniref:hypothetical protein n=1 Tax=Acinetobacter pittii TaxID=48296 RepID=UPI00280F2EEA|nr:hypothetical protein [Acinetobacter pittii]MDQ9034688.1 hypothetical protein [Acinetobacter pittii]MDQ9079651.1 hypothetical protein [Acinetobacter pittii]